MVSAFTITLNQKLSGSTLTDEVGDIMKYYRANCDAYDHFNQSSLIKGELCTPKERDVLFRYIADECFDTVHVKKTETYTFFGARFPDENAIIIVYKEKGCLR